MAVPWTRRNLLYEKTKVILSVFGVAAALTLIVLLLGFRNGLYATLTAYIDNLGTDLIVAQSGVKGLFSSNSAVPLTIHEDLVTATGAVEAGHVVVADVIFAYGADKTPVLLVGYEPETGIGSPWKLDRGREVHSGNEVLLDLWLARRNGLDVGDQVQLLGRAFTIVGLTRETSSWMSPYVFVSLDAAERVLGLPGIVSFHLLRLPDGTKVGTAKATIEERFPGVEALTPSEMASTDRRILATVMDTPINVMLVISFVIGVAVMGLTTYTAVVDRVREYGVLKAIGARGGWLRRHVVQETFARTSLGFIVGAGLSYSTTELIMYLWPQFTIVIRPDTLLWVGAASLMMTLLASLLPIRRVIAIDPALVFKA
jgi:putative ABC transport system permease protein